METNAYPRPLEDCGTLILRAAFEDSGVTVKMFEWFGDVLALCLNPLKVVLVKCPEGRECLSVLGALNRYFRAVR